MISSILFIAWVIVIVLAVIFGILTAIRLTLRRIWGTIDKENEISANGKLVLITGAGSGIGRAAALEFATRNATVILGDVDLDKANESVSYIRKKTEWGQLICMKIDLASLDSIREFCDTFKSQYDHLDILVNNAGVLFPPGENKRTEDNFEIHFGLNYLGHFLLTNLLLGHLKKATPSRIVMLTSTGHSWSSLDFEDLMSEKKNMEGFYVSNPLYCNSKLAIALFNKELGKHRLQGTGVNTYAMCPGFVAGTNIAQHVFKGPDWLNSFLQIIPSYVLKSPKEGAATILHCALNKGISHENGCMYIHCGSWDPSTRTPLLDKDAKRLWTESIKLVGLLEE